MIKRILFFIFLVGVIMNSVFSQEITVENLLSNVSEFDKQEVQVSGEILTVMPLKNGSWINLNDNGNSIGVWCNAGVYLPEIKNTASYKQDGDFLKVKGIFNKSSADNYGEQIIEALELQVKYAKKAKKEIVSENKKTILELSALSLGALILVYLIKRYFDDRRSKKHS